MLMGLNATAIGMFALMAAVSSEAAPQLVVSCLPPTRAKGEIAWFEVPVKITNNSGEPVTFLAGGSPRPDVEEFVSRKKEPGRWKNITPSMKGMCALGCVAAQTKTLAPGGTFDTHCSVLPDFRGHYFRVSLSFSTAKRKSQKVYSEPILLK